MSKISYITPLYFDADSYVGGGERYPTNLARGVTAVAPRFAIEIVSFGPSPYEHALFPGVTLRVLKAGLGARNPLDVISADLAAVVEEADLVHIHQIFTRCGEMGTVIAKQLFKPLCISDHGGSSSSLGKNLRILDLADRIVCQSHFAASLLCSKVRKDVIPGGVDGSTFSPAPTPRRRERVLYVGRLLPHKGVERLIAALPLDLPLTICGNNYDDEYFSWLRSISRGRNVEFVVGANDSDLVELYRSAWATVLPSVYFDRNGNAFEAPELMGFTLLESMACGTPAVCSRVGAMSEFVENGETGYVFDTLEELSRVLTVLAEDASLVEVLGSKGRSAIEERFDMKVAGGRLSAVYDEVLAACGS